MCSLAPRWFSWRGNETPGQSWVTAEWPKFRISRKFWFIGWGLYVPVHKSGSKKSPVNRYRTFYIKNLFYDARFRRITKIPRTITGTYLCSMVFLNFTIISFRKLCELRCMLIHLQFLSPIKCSVDKWENFLVVTWIRIRTNFWFLANSDSDLNTAQSDISRMATNHES
jgi:hypothetical protein